ncbi:hypothetical protein K4K59_004640 [Colletotrichum sp. SAR11_240]|nr:hypothetical protein K4K59_004640 [Colletotrichum sp. SAR11_240]
MIRPSTLAGIAALWVTTSVNVVHCQFNYLGCGAITDVNNQFYNIGIWDPSGCQQHSHEYLDRGHNNFLEQQHIKHRILIYTNIDQRH